MPKRDCMGQTGQARRGRGRELGKRAAAEAGDVCLIGAAVCLVGVVASPEVTGKAEAYAGMLVLALVGLMLRRLAR